MDYKKLYDSICNRAKEEGREKGTGIYYELHHIVPRCVGGSNCMTNLVLLTGREHFLVHKILIEIYPESKGLKQAIWNMAITKGDIYKVSARDYERARKIHCELTIERNSVPVEQYDLKGNKIRDWESSTQADRELGLLDGLVANSVRGTTITAGGFIFIKPEDRDQVHVRIREYTKSKKFKNVYQYSLDFVHINTFYGYSEACAETGVSIPSLCRCIKGKNSTASGYIWSDHLLTEKEISDIMLKKYHNIKLGREKSKVTKGKPVVQLTLENIFVNEFVSGRDAERQTKYNNISDVCNGIRNQSNGYKFMWKDDYMLISK